VTAEAKDTTVGFLAELSLIKSLTSSALETNQVMCYCTYAD